MRLEKLRKFFESQGLTLLRAEIALGVAIIFAIFFYNNGQSWDHGQLLDLKLAITLAIVEVPLLMFTPILYRFILNESRKHAEEEKRIRDQEKHTKDLVDKIYKKLLTIRIGSINNKEEFQVERFDDWTPLLNDLPPERLWMSVSELPYPYFGYSLDHLKEYDDIFKHWKIAMNLFNLLGTTTNPREIEITKTAIQQSFLEFREKLSKLIARLEAGETLRGICELGY